MPAEWLGPVTTALGGLLGPKNPSPKQQAYGSLKGAFKAADEAGIHRLAVAGSPAGYSPAPSSAAEGIMAAGQQISNQVGSKKEGQLIDAQIEEARSRTMLNQANTRRALMGPQPNLGQVSTRAQNIVDSDRTAFDNTATGRNRRVVVDPERDLPATQTVTLGNMTGRGLNPEAFEIGLSELIAGAMIYGPQWAADAARQRQGNPALPSSRRPSNSERTLDYEESTPYIRPQGSQSRR